MTRVAGGVVALFAAAMAFVAVTVPFHATDALIYGRWSRLIALDGGIAFDGIGSGYLHRPLVYVVQGWLWGLLGFHEWIGRVWALLFLALLVWAVVRLAALDRGGALAGALAGLLLVASPDVVALGAAGLTDVPVAALAAATGLLALAPSRRPPLVDAALIALSAALAALAKPSAFFALAGIGLALLVGPRAQLAARLVRRGAPLVAGGALALAWDAIQAARTDVPLTDFLQGADAPLAGAVTALYAELNAQSRGSFIAAMEWLGPYLVLPLLFGLLYAVLRVAGRPHRQAVTWGAPAALALAIVLPLLADGAAGPFDPDRPVALLATLALIVPLWLARDCPPEEAPTRAHLARMLVWAAPPTLAWIVSAPFQTRYLSPAWAPLYVLVAAALWTALRGLQARRAGLGWVVVAVLCVVALVDLRNLDGLGSGADGSIDATRAVRELGVTGWFDADRARAAADPSLAALRDATGAALAERDGGLVTSDGRLGFYWPERVTRAEPQTCAAVEPYALLVVTEARTGLTAEREARVDDEAVGGNATDPAFWRACRAPRLTELAARPGEFTVFAVEAR